MIPSHVARLRDMLTNAYLSLSAKFHSCTKCSIVIVYVFILLMMYFFIHLIICFPFYKYVFVSYDSMHCTLDMKLLSLAYDDHRSLTHHGGH